MGRFFTQCRKLVYTMAAARTSWDTPKICLHAYFLLFTDSQCGNISMRPFRGCCPPANVVLETLISDVPRNSQRQITPEWPQWHISKLEACEWEQDHPRLDMLPLWYSQLYKFHYVHNCTWILRGLVPYQG